MLFISIPDEEASVCSYATQSNTYREWGKLANTLRYFVPISIAV